MVLKQLDTLRTDNSGCELLALVDISTGLVLGVSAAQKTPQEKLDRYCKLATELLDGDTGTAFTKAANGNEAEKPKLATVLVSKQVFIAIRTSSENGETMIGLGSPDLNTDAFESSARTYLEELAVSE